MRIPAEANFYVEKLNSRFSASVSWILRLAMAERKLRQELEASQRLVKVAQKSAGTTTVAELAEVVLAGAKEETKMDFGVVRLYDAEKDIWLRAAPSTDVDIEVFPDELVTNNALGQWMKAKKPVYQPDAQSDPGWLADCQASRDGPRRDFLMSIRSWIAVPMWIGDKFLGGILLQSTESDSLSEDTRQHLEILAGFAATAIRSAQILQKQLDVAEPFALVGTMLGGFLHQMRNEQTAAIAYCDNIGNLSHLPEDARERLAKLDGSLRAIGSICRGLTSFDPGVDAVAERVELNELLDEIWNDLSRRINLERYNVQRLYDQDKPFVMGSRVQLETAVRMLVQNAIEALEEVKSEKRTILLQTRIRHNRVILRIADSGGGMIESTKRRAFHPFFTTKAVGNGLGLAIVNRVARRHGAQVKLSTRVGRGTSVSLLFPKEVGMNG